jgi:ubiquinone/menaquinone biosynthesis C-methylase UbiE
VGAAEEAATVMTLLEEYKKQFAWRDWENVLSKCPILPGQRVLDLGCGPGDISAELIARGARVTGIDADNELLAAARRQCPTGLFENQDLNNLKLPRNSFDGLWSSFTVGYLINFEKTLSSWRQFLTNDAWICIVEIDDLLGHDPLSKETRTLIETFYEDAFKKKRYDFTAGRKIRSILEGAGFRVEEIELADQELSFKGAAQLEILQAWRNRFNRMGGLRAFLRDQYAAFVKEFIDCISSENHLARCKVIACISTTPKNWTQS